MSSIINQIIQNNSPLKVSCINSKLSDVEKDLISIVNSSFGDGWNKKKYKLINQQQVETILEEPDSKSITFLLWTPALNQNKFTVFLNNFTDGWITLLNKYSYNYNKEIASVTFSNGNTNYPVFRFLYRNGTVIRNVQLLKDTNKWEFYSEGEPLSIEEVTNYKQMRNVNKLNNEIIENYMKKLGFDCTKKEFWLSNEDAIEYKFMLE